MYTLNNVSIQLISPTRGDLQQKLADQILQLSFHSTDFPYERGPALINAAEYPELVGFHSTDFPYERGPAEITIASKPPECDRVSIQLISPTRGDRSCIRSRSPSVTDPGFSDVSIQLISPTRGDLMTKVDTPEYFVFPFN